MKMINAKAKITSFFIFNSNFGSEEGEEHKKILFYHPPQTNLDTRKIQVGLCEAVIKFMSTFSQEPCEALQTQTQRYIFYQPEKDFWMILIVRIPYTTKALPPVGETRNEIVSIIDQQFAYITPSLLYIEPAVLYDMLISAYKIFSMFMGPLSEIPPQDLYLKCEQFFTPYLSSKNIQHDLSEVFSGINYLPLDKNSFFKVMCLIDLVEVNYPEFKCASFIYNDQLIWNGLATKDMSTLYQYLVQTLLPEQVAKEIQGGVVARAQRHGGYISPPDGIRTAQDLHKLNKVYLMREEDDTPQQYYLVVYRTLSATVCFTIDVNTRLEVESFRALDAFFGPQLSQVASTISEQVAFNALQNSQVVNSDTKFVYFNRLNLAFKTSASINKLIPSTAVKPEVLSIIAEMHADKQSLGNHGEIIIKTPDECWITGKTSNDREFYVIIQQKGANLKEIAEEVKRISEAQMKGIFFYPL